MGALFERPAFLVLFLLLLAVVVIVVLVIVTASRSSSTAPAAPPVAAPSVGGPGWYPQPDGTQRYWDGRAWTDHTA